MSVQVEIDFDPDKWIENTVKPAVDDGVGRAALVLSTAMSSSMPGQGASAISFGNTLNKSTGKYRKKIVYVSSDPGSPPGVRTGQLRNSITHERIKQMQWAAGTNIPYGRHHEFGTADMPARPWARPAVEKSKKKMMKAFNAGVRMAMRYST